jgi:hypothetical protein
VSHPVTALENPPRTSPPPGRSIPGSRAISAAFFTADQRLSCFITGDRIVHHWEFLEPDQAFFVVPLRVPIGKAVPMLPDALFEIAGDTDVRASGLAGDNVDKVLPVHGVVLLSTQGERAITR